MTATPIPLAITGEEMKDKGKGNRGGSKIPPPQGNPELIYNFASNNDPLLDFSNISFFQKFQNSFCKPRLAEQLSHRTIAWSDSAP